MKHSSEEEAYGKRSGTWIVLTQNKEVKFLGATQGFNQHRQSSCRIQVPTRIIIQQFISWRREVSLSKNSKLPNIKDL